MSSRTHTAKSPAFVHSAARVVAVAAMLAAVMPLAPSPATADVLIEQVLVNVASASGTASRVPLDASRTYRIEAAGTYTYGPTGGAADAECASAVQDSAYQRNLFSGVMPHPDPLDLVVSGGQVDWVAIDPSPFGCDSTTAHTYTVTFKPSKAGVLVFSIADTNHADNSGVLTVTIFERTGNGTTPPASVFQLAETVSVDTANPAGASTAVPLVAGETYLLEASGTWAYTATAGRADPECASATATPSTWARNGFGLYQGKDNLDLLVGGASFDWLAAGGDATGCATSLHRYQLAVVPDTTANVIFRVLDANYADNAGTLTVKVFRKVL